MSDWPPELTFEELCEACLRAEATNPPELAEAERRLYEAIAAAERRGVKATVADIVELTRNLPPNLTPDQLDRLRDQVTKAASIHLGPELAAQAQPSIVRAMDIAYRYGRQSVPLPSDGNGAGGVASQPFNVSDQRALDWLHRDVMFWVGQSDQRKLVTIDGERVELGQFIALTVRDGVEAGESSTHIGRRVQKALAGQVGERSDSYWRGLAANAATRASAFGMVEGFIQADVTRYEILAVMDERTSPVCRELNGKVFEVQHAIRQRNRLMAAQSPDEVRAISPWVKAADVADLEQAGGTDALAAAGVALPPFHFHCRTTVVVAEAGYTVTSEAPVPPLPDPRVDEERRIAFVEAFDPHSRDLYDPQWSATQRGGVFRGQLIGPDGFAVGTEYRDPFMRGLRLSAWPTHAPTDLDTFWRPEPSPAGGRWLSVSDRCVRPKPWLFCPDRRKDGAILSERFTAWQQQASAEEIYPDLRSPIAKYLKRLADADPRRVDEARGILNEMARLSQAGKLTAFDRWVRTVSAEKHQATSNLLNEGLEALLQLRRDAVKKVELAMDARTRRGPRKAVRGGYDMLVQLSDGSRRRVEVKTIQSHLTYTKDLIDEIEEALWNLRRDPEYPAEVSLYAHLPQRIEPGDTQTLGLRADGVRNIGVPGGGREHVHIGDDLAAEMATFTRGRRGPRGKLQQVNVRSRADSSTIAVVGQDRKRRWSRIE